MPRVRRLSVRRGTVEQPTGTAPATTAAAEPDDLTVLFRAAARLCYLIDRALDGDDGERKVCLERMRADVRERLSELHLCAADLDGTFPEHQPEPVGV